ncbi:MAG TPA: hypothetical protein VGP07_02940 [Polyangia bacterium]
MTSIDSLGGKGRPANIQASCIVFDDPAPPHPVAPPVAVPPVPGSPRAAANG